MDMYYDNIKYINIHNIQNYKLQEIKIDGKKLTVPDDLIKITLNENPIQMKLKKLFKNSYSMLGLNSNIIENFDVEKENITLDGKTREKNIIKMIRDFDKKFNIFIFNYKTEIWNLFKEIQFDVILYETEKNFTSMRSILEKNDYIFYENVFIHKNYLIQ